MKNVPAPQGDESPKEALALWRFHVKHLAILICHPADGYISDGEIFRPSVTEMPILSSPISPGDLRYVSFMEDLFDWERS